MSAWEQLASFSARCMCPAHTAQGSCANGEWARAALVLQAAVSAAWHEAAAGADLRFTLEKQLKLGRLAIAAPGFCEGGSKDTSE